MPYQVRLEMFEGPIDLLLHLITKRRVDIYDVPLAAITDEYLAVVKKMESFDLESATGFLIVAATLLELKSARLLPSPLDEEMEGKLLEERDALLARLVECATFREAGAWIQTRLAAGEGFYGRTAGLEPQFVDLAPDLLAHTTTTDLGVAAARLLAPKPRSELELSHVAPIRVTVREAILDLAQRLREGPPATFRELCGEGRPKIEVIVRFLALLEMFKAGAVDLEQGERFGDIRALWLGETDDEELIAGVDEYALQEEETP